MTNKTKNDRFAVRITCDTPGKNWTCLAGVDVPFDIADLLAKMHNKSCMTHDGIYDESFGVAEVINMADIPRINFAAIEEESGTITSKNRLHFTDDMYINDDGNLYSTEHLEDGQTTGSDRNALELIKSAAAEARK